MSTKSLKGYRVTRRKDGRVVLERIPFYGRDASTKIRMRKSRKVRPASQHELALYQSSQNRGK